MPVQSQVYKRPKISGRKANTFVEKSSVSIISWFPILRYVCTEGPQGFLSLFSHTHPPTLLHFSQVPAFPVFTFLLRPSFSFAFTFPFSEISSTFSFSSPVIYSAVSCCHMELPLLLFLTSEKGDDRIFLWHLCDVCCMRTQSDSNSCLNTGQKKGIKAK